MESIIVAHANSKEEELALKNYLKKAKIKFTSNKSQPFNSEFEKKIEKRINGINDGKGIEVSNEELEALCK